MIQLFIRHISFNTAHYANSQRNLLTRVRECAFWDVEQTLSLNLGSTQIEHGQKIARAFPYHIRYDLVMMLTSSPITALPSPWKNVSLLYNYNVLSLTQTTNAFRDFQLELSDLGLIIQKLN